jgi:hypothetical protein
VTPHEARVRALAQVIADSFFAMQAGQAWDAEGPESYSQPEISAGDMQLATDIIDAGYGMIASAG